MALQKQQLKQSILKILSDPKGSDSASKAKAAWADAYDSYARGAMDVSGDAVSLVNKPGFQSALGFSSSAGSIASAASEYERAFLAYWTGGLFSVGAPPSPAAICPSIPPAPPFLVEITATVIAAIPGLAGLLTPILSDNKTTDLDARASKMADAFHTATTSFVLVLITGITIPIPPSPVGIPVTNTCTLS